MRRYARFAALSLSLLALPALAADLRAVKEPAKIAGVFPAAAKLRVINVWAMWCAPCVAEMPDLRAIDEAFGAEVALAGVSLDDMLPDASPQAVRAFLDKHRIAFPNVYYTGNADALGDYLRFNGELPITIVYDRNGKELWRHQGRINREQTIARLRDLLRRNR
ncbi:MAG TPA: TlpA disulfide reductase family protein [Thermoanaerobaculia bacterium]|nr:TlpA disulfide reductase family protein [Thermoanaerobaculia bacterium]